MCQFSVFLCSQAVVLSSLASMKSVAAVSVALLLLLLVEVDSVTDAANQHYHWSEEPRHEKGDPCDTDGDCQTGLKCHENFHYEGTPENWTW